MVDSLPPGMPDKALLRRQGHAARIQAALSFPDAPLRARDVFLGSVPIATHDIIALTLPMGDELDTAPLCSALAALGATLALPVVVRKGHPLSFRRFDPGQPCVKGILGNPEPPPEAPQLRPTLLVVPFLAFDREGKRLGRGGGYYDRTLTALRQNGAAPRVIGYGYAAQEAPRLPAEPHDEPLDDVITEKEWIRCLRRT